MSAPASRRGFLRGIATITAAGGAGVGLPALAATTAAQDLPHPDQALIDAEVAYRQAFTNWLEASEADRAASRAFSKAFGPCPVELVMTPWEERFLVSFGSRLRGVGSLWTEVVPYRLKPGDDPHAWHNPDHAWTIHSLERIVKIAPAVLGRGGQTPHRIKRWRSLMPMAAEREAKRAALAERFRTRELFEAARAADTARNSACARVDGMPAVTLDGLAIKTRCADESYWRTMHPAWKTLLTSAAAICGVTLRERQERER